MLLLAIEQSTRTCSLALMRDGTQVASKRWSDGIHQRQRLFAMLPELLAESNLHADIEHFVVGTGPGSFAGIRIAIAACHGLAQPSHTPVSGLSSTAVLAWRALQTNPDAKALVVGDARRGQFWCAAYRMHKNQMKTTLEPQLIPPETLGDQIEGDCVILSPDLDRIGDALRVHAAGRCRLIPEMCIPAAGDLAHLAHAQLPRGDALPPPIPIYLHPAVFVAPRFPPGLSCFPSQNSSQCV
ncbi:MAG: tRNA (adenosine(37)-N6)-threonylcarbamoyltransferase complex dimerization subunit type 1 TsaB [Verrucomicrobia bacterium]|nr:tRNA (adenosine(37)-N6)-threonylcarbamoyltransferase complex dimerization subunit type 1 TsaB [Verrucomicrobiota bacterium]